MFYYLLNPPPNVLFPDNGYRKCVAFLSSLCLGWPSTPVFPYINDSHSLARLSDAYNVTDVSSRQHRSSLIFALQNSITQMSIPPWLPCGDKKCNTSLGNKAADYINTEQTGYNIRITTDTSNM